MASEVRRSRYQFDADDRTKAALDSMGKGLERAGASLKNLAIGFALGGGGIGAFVASSMQSIDALAKQADGLQTSTEALAAYHAAAELAGVGTEQFDNSLGTLQQNIGLAANGNEKAAKAFEQLGLNVEELSQLSGEAQFEVVAEKIRGVGNASQQAAFAQKTFGDASREFLGFVREGPGALEAAKKETEALGIALSRVDANKVEQANDAVDRAKGVFQGVGNTIAVAVSPVISALADRFVDSAVEAGGFKDVVDAAMRFVAEAIGYVANVIRGIEVAFKAAQVVGAAFGAAVLTAFDLIVGGALRVDSAVGNFLNKIIDAINQFTDLEIPRFDTSGVDELANTISGTAQAARENVVALEGELAAMASEPLPHDNVVAFFDEASKAAQASAEQAVATKEAFKGVFVPEETDAELEKQREALQKKLDALLESNMNENEALRVKHEEQLAIIAEAQANGLIQEEAANQARLDVETKFQDQLTALGQKGGLDRENFQSLSWQRQGSIVAGALEDMTAGVANSNKTMFKINKIAAIANAIINTSQGVTKALATYPPPISFVMAAVQLAAGLAQISAIKATQFGGGTTPSTAGRTATYNGNPVGPQGNVGGQPTPAGGGGGKPGTGSGPPKKVIQINGLSDGDLLSGRAVRQLIGAIEAEAGDGVKITVRSAAAGAQR